VPHVTKTPATPEPGCAKIQLMGRTGTAKNHRKGSAPAEDRARGLVSAAGLVLFLAEVLVLPAAASPFRTPKMSLATGGLAAVVALAAARHLWGGTPALPAGRRVAALLLALPILQAASAAWSADPRAALATAAASVIWVAAAMAGAVAGRKALARLALWAGAGATVSGLVMVLQLAGVSVLDVGRTGRFALTGLAGNPADLAMGTLMLVPFLLAPLAAGATGRGPAVAGFFLVAVGLATRTLTGLLAAGLMFLVWLVRARSRRLRAVAAGILAVGLAAALLGGTGDRLREVAARARAGDWYGALSARADGWTAAVEMVRQHPLAGVGAGNFGRSFYEARLAWLDRTGGHGGRGEAATHFTWAHCDPLQLVAELGLPGLAWLAALLAVALPRLRGDPVLQVGAAAAVPFLLLHYPAHLALGLVPLALLAAGLMSATGNEEPAPRLALPTPAARTLAVLCLAGAAAAVTWQVRTVRSSLWMGSLHRVLVRSDGLPPAVRGRALSLAAATISRRLEDRPSEAPVLLPELGRALLAAGDARGAEDAYRKALRVAPRAESALGLGLALAAQGRVTEALVWLERAGRVNPTLLELVPDPGLRKSARALATSRRR